MQSSLFEPGHLVLVAVRVARKLRPCPSYSRRRDRIDLELWRSLYKGGGGGIYKQSHSDHAVWGLAHGTCVWAHLSAP